MTECESSARDALKRGSGVCNYFGWRFNSRVLSSVGRGLSELPGSHTDNWENASVAQSLLIGPFSSWTINIERQLPLLRHFFDQDSPKCTSKTFDFIPRRKLRSISFWKKNFMKFNFNHAKVRYGVPYKSMINASRWLESEKIPLSRNSSISNPR